MDPEPEPGPESEKIFIPPDFYCPITGELLVNPVSEPSGHTYEKDSILEWLKIKNESPLTKQPLHSSQLTDNLAMKRSIDSIRHKIQEDQLKIESRVVEERLEPFKSVLHTTKIEQFMSPDKLVVSITPPDITTRPPIDVVLCIDVSMSMSQEAKLKGDRNETLSHGISVLSLTISAAKTILYSLNENDNISVVTYSSEARTVVKNMPCSSDNQQVIAMELDNLKVISNTNMWNGIVESLDILKECSPYSKNKGILLLTDGVPNAVPPRGHESMLKRYFEQHNFKCPISCYGFGYDLDSELLMNLSDISGGDGYSFIPDASILGSVFINGISNLLTTACNNCKVRVELKKGSRFKYSSERTIEIEIDSLKYGKSKNFLIDIDTKECSSSRVSYLEDSAEVTLILPDCEIKSNLSSFKYDKIFQQTVRLNAIEIINGAIQSKKYNDNSFQEKIESFLLIMRERPGKYVNNFIEDFNTQIKEALNLTTRGSKEDWFNRWGIHYLRSLQNAYKNEMCNNFKDKGILNFKCKMFDKQCDEISTVFEAIPPPKPDIVRPPVVTRGGGMGVTIRNQTQAPLRSMSVYNNASGGCCTGDSAIQIVGGSINASSISKGDTVVSYDVEINDYIETKIVCVVKTQCYGGKELLTIVSDSNNPDLKITPYHPLFKNDTWFFPINHPNNFITKVMECDYIYTFVTENRKPIVVNGHIYATLGHNSEGEIIQHPYFGTNKVIDDLIKLDGWDSGLVNLNKDMFRREGDIVCKIE
jgi:Mg-chelatase subunit ChlD